MIALDKAEKNIANTTASLILVLIVALGAFLRFKGIGEGSASLIEAHAITDSETLGMAFRKLIHPPLYYALLHGWALLFDDSVVSLRCFSAFFGCLSIPLLYFITRDLTRHQGTALLASTFLAILPLALWHSREIRHYSLWFFFFLVALWGLLGFARTSSSRARLAAYYLGSVGGIATHYYMVFYLLALVPSSFLLFGKKPLVKTYEEWRRWIAIHLPFLALPLAVFAGFSLKSEAPVKTILNKAEWGNPAVAGAPDSWSNLANLIYTQSDLTPENFVAGTIILLLLIAATLLLVRDPKLNRRAAYAVALCAFLPYFAITWLPIRSEQIRYFFLTSSMEVILLAYLFTWPFRVSHRAKNLLSYGLPAVGALVLVAGAISLGPYIERNLTTEYEDWNSVCDLLQSREADRDVIIINEPYMIHALKICYRGNAAILGSPVADIHEVKEGTKTYEPAEYRPNPRRLKGILKDHDHAWLIYSHAYHTDPRRRIIFNIMRKQFRSYSAYQFPGIKIFRYRGAKADSGSPGGDLIELRDQAPATGL